jgi:hypothetical protein
MRKLFLILPLLLASVSQAQTLCPSTSGTVAFLCAAGATTADVAAAISAATDGAVITFSPGTYGNIIFPKFSSAKGVTVQCATPYPIGTISITAWSITSNVATFTAANSLVAGQTVTLSAFGTSTFFNNYPMTVIATGLSSTQFEANFTHANGSATESGTGNLEAGGAITNACIINAHVSGTFPNQTSSTIFGTDALSGNNTKFYRISGFTFDGGGSTVQPTFGTIYFDSYNGSQNATMSGPAGNGGFRLDHNTFRNSKTGSQMFLCGSVPGPPIIMNCYGVIDHNLYVNPTTLSMAISVGNFPNPKPAQPQMGTIYNTFMENNVLNFAATGNTSAEGCVDNWIGPYVIRHNVALNCLWLNHGETHLGGPINFEFYNNASTITDTTTGVGDCNEQVHLQGAGTVMLFNNTCMPASGHTNNGFQFQEYRGGAGTAGNTFSVTAVAVGPGSAITYTGTGLASAPHGWYNFSGFVNAGNNTFTQITSSTATTLVGITTKSLLTQVNESGATATANFSSQDGSAPQCDGTVASPATVVWATTAPDGNRSPIATYRGYPCGNQPGRDLAGNIQPIYAANNLFQDNGAILPMKFGSVGGVLDYFSAHMQSQREWFDEVGNTAQSNATTPFNGTTGTGWGTLANRPTTCTSNTTENAFGAGTSGVGYYATDQGSQGTWYKCTATNTWTSFYTPYTYPHPLVTATSAPVATFSVNPVNIGQVPVGFTSNPTATITLTNTGTANLVVSSVLLHIPVFSLVNNTCGTPATINSSTPGVGFTLTPDSSCTFQVQAQAPAGNPQAWSDTATFGDNTPATFDSLLLTMNAAGPPAPTIGLSARRNQP